MGQEYNMKIFSNSGHAKELIKRLIAMWIGSIIIIAFTVNTADWYGWMGSIFVLFGLLFAWSYLVFIIWKVK